MAKNDSKEPKTTPAAEEGQVRQLTPLEVLQLETDRLQRQLDHKDTLLEQKNNEIAELQSECARLRSRLDEVTSVDRQLAGGVRGMVQAAEGHLLREEFEEMAKEDPSRVFVVVEDFNGPDGQIKKHTKLEARQYPSMPWWIDAGLRVVPMERPVPKAARREVAA
jgi:hypothetical protein